jgi:hypothetical protein
MVHHQSMGELELLRATPSICLNTTMDDTPSIVVPKSD